MVNKLLNKSKKKDTGKTIIIAEVGVNHDGSLDKAKKLIRVAKNCKADYVKFQTFNPDNLIIKNHTKSDYQVGRTNKKESLHKMLDRLSFNFNQTKKIFLYAKKIGIKCLSTPFDNESIDFLHKLKVDFFKVSSGDINNYPLLKKIASKKKPIIISTGRSYLKEVKKTVKFLEDNNCHKIYILHCTSIYPAKANELNLFSIRTLKENFKYPIGYSDHSEGTIAPIIAVSLGANIIEKHLTLNKKDVGPDHLASLEPNEFFKMVSQIRNTESILGSSIKKPCQNELKGRIHSRRGLYASNDLKKNQIIQKKDISIKRPASFIGPEKFNNIIGKKMRRSLKKDQPFDLKNIK